MIQEQKNTRALVVTAGLTETKAQKDQVAISFALQDGPDAGQSIGYFGSLSDAAIPYTTKNLRTLGWKDGDDLGLLAGSECRLTIAHETYEGKTSAKVKFINPLVPALTKLDPVRASSAMSRLSAAAKALDSAPVAQAEPPPHTDADLPF